ncbi:MAG: DUF2785 domain-containing protein [Thalassotalea sp.]|nr:DUF2785 domain-containing protein [Thalassotalea sp.]
MKIILLTPSLSILCITSNSSIANAQQLILAAKVAAKCESSSWNKATLLSLKEQDFVLENAEEKRLLAKQLLHCLASPDPSLRDTIAFTGLSQWSRANDFNAEFYHEIYAGLLSVITSEVIDEHAVYKSFSMLMLSEIARVDRKTPFLTDLQRENLVETGTDFLQSVEDYRGYDSTIGWRHSVAHSADLMLQLSLNPAIKKQHLNTMLAAISTQIVAKNSHFYIYGEAKRLAMPVIYIFLNDVLTIEDWNVWLNNLAAPSPLKSWGNAYSSQQGLSKLHNTQSFLFAFYALIKNSKNERLSNMVPALEEAIKRVN